MFGGEFLIVFEVINKFGEFITFSEDIVPVNPVFGLSDGFGVGFFGGFKCFLGRNEHILVVFVESFVDG